MCKWIIVKKVVSERDFIDNGCMNNYTDKSIDPLFEKL